MTVSRKTLLGIAGALSALALAPQPAVAGTVVASSGPSAQEYPVGTQIGDAQRISLRQGDTVTVLQNGRTRTFRGPGDFVLSQRGGRSDSRTFAALTSRRASDRAQIGAMRADPSMAAPNPNLWYVDIAKSGTICLANPDPLQFWRSPASAEATYSVTREGSPQEAVGVTFPEGASLGTWNGAIQLREGETYTIAGTEGPVRLRFVFLQEVPADAEELALALIENGCTVQLDQMTTALAE